MAVKVSLFTAASAVALSAGVLSIGAAPAFAQDGDAGAERERIVITAQKREQDRIDVPINIDAFSAGQLQDLGIGEFQDLTDYIPGLEIQEQSPNTPSFAIRGITSDDTASNVEPRVSIFYDGVPGAKAVGSVVELFDLERVEVAKGPQSTLFGRAALIGAINVVQQKPVFDYEAGGELSLGNLGYNKVGGFVNFELVEDILAVRVAGVGRTRDGYTENTLGADLDGENTQAIRASVRYEPSERLRADLIFNWEHNNPPGTGFKSGVFPTPGGDTSPFTAAALNTIDGFSGDRDLFVDRELFNATAILSYDLSDAVTLTSVSGFRSTDSRELFDPDGSFLQFVAGDITIESEQFSQELRLNFDNGGRIEAFGGINYFREYGFRDITFATDEATAQVLNIDALVAGAGLPDVPTAELLLAQGIVAQAAPLIGLNPAVIPTLSLTDLNAIIASVGQPIVDLDNLANPYPFSVAALAGAGQLVELGLYSEDIVDKSSVVGWDIFGDVTLHVTDRFSVIAGLRVSNDSKRVQAFNRLREQNDVTPFPTLLLPVTFDLANGIPGGVVTGDEEFDGETYRLVGQFRATENVNLWASYARGRRPEVLSTLSGTVPVAPGVTLDAIVGTDVVPAETVDSYEAGFYADLMGGDLTWSGSVYFYEYENFQLSILEQGRVNTINGGDASGPGLETAVTWIAGPNTTLFGSYGYQGAEFDGTSGDAAAQGLDLDDTRFRLSPEHQFTIGGDFTRPWTGDRTLFMRPTYAYKSEVFFENGNPAEFSQDGYGLFSTRVGVEQADGSWRAEVFVKNAFDEEYIIDAGNTGLSFGSPTFIAGAPRTYGVTFVGRF